MACMMLDSSHPNYDPLRFDDQRAAQNWTGELCAYARHGLIFGHVTMNAGNACDGSEDSSTAPQFSSIEGRLAGSAAGPLEVTLRLMGPEVVSAPSQYLGGCTYRSNFTVGTAGRYNVQISLWRRGWGALLEDHSSWLHWQLDQPFGGELWVHLNASTLTTNTCERSKHPLQCWDELSAGIPACDCGSLQTCANAQEGRWLTTVPPFSGYPNASVLGRNTALRWSADYLSEIGWRRYHCADRLGSQHPRVRDVLKGRRLLVVGDSQSRFLFNGLMKFHSNSEGRASKGSGGGMHACFDMEEQQFGPGSIWCAAEDSMGDDIGNLDSLSLPGGETGATMDILILLVGNHHISEHRWDMGQWAQRAARLASELTAFSLAHNATVLWMGNPAFPIRRDEWARVTFRDTRTNPRLMALNAIAARELASAVAATGDPSLRQRVVFIDGLMRPTFSLLDASKDDAHFGQDPVQRHFAQLILEALRAASPR